MVLIEELPSDDEIPEDVPASTKGKLYRYSTNRSIPFTLSFATALPLNSRQFFRLGPGCAQGFADVSRRLQLATRKPNVQQCYG